MVLNVSLTLFYFLAAWNRDRLKDISNIRCLNDVRVFQGHLTSMNKSDDENHLQYMASCKIGDGRGTECMR